MRNRDSRYRCQIPHSTYCTTALPHSQFLDTALVFRVFFVVWRGATAQHIRSTYIYRHRAQDTHTRHMRRPTRARPMDPRPFVLTRTLHSALYNTSDFPTPTLHHPPALGVHLITRCTGQTASRLYTAAPYRNRNASFQQVPVHNTTRRGVIGTPYSAPPVCAASVGCKDQ